MSQSKTEADPVRLAGGELAVVDLEVVVQHDRVRRGGHARAQLVGERRHPRVQLRGGHQLPAPRQPSTWRAR